MGKLTPAPTDTPIADIGTASRRIKELERQVANLTTTIAYRDARIEELAKVNAEHAAQAARLRMTIDTHERYLSLLEAASGVSSPIPLRLSR